MNYTEKFVQRLYKSLSIDRPDQLNISNISNKMNLTVIYWDETSEVVFYKGKYKVFINQNLSPQQQWQDFGHEICHILRHDGDQNGMVMSFLELQEWQANYFSYHFCVPTFMLDELKIQNATDILNNFNVEYDFALKRLEMYQSKLLGGVIYGERIC